MALGRTQFEKLVKRKMETGKIDRIKLIGQVMSYYKEGINVMTPDFKVYLSWACALGMCSSNGNPVYCRELLNAIKTNMENSEASAQTVSAATWTADEFDSIWDNSGMMNLNLSGALTREYKEAVKGAKEAEDALTNSDDLFRQAAENSQPVNMSGATSGDDADLLNYYEENEDGYDEADYEDIESSTEEAEYDYETEYEEAEEVEEDLVEVEEPAEETAEKPAEEPVEKPAEAEKASSEKNDEEQFKKEDELLKAITENYMVKGCIDNKLKATIDSLYDLYSPNLTGIPHEGLFMPRTGGGSPLWSFKASTGDVIEKPCQVYDSGTRLDTVICEVLSNAAPQLCNYVTPDPNTGFPEFAKLDQVPYMLEAQLMFQSANVRLSGHLARKNSIRHWNTVTNAGADVKSSRLNSIKHYKEWLDWVIRSQYARYIVEDFGEQEIRRYLANDQEMINCGDRLDAIADKFNLCLRNVVAVKERKRNDNDNMETTSIATIIPSIDPEAIASELVKEGVLNTYGSTLVKAKGSIVKDIKTIKIAYDGKFVATSIYAGEIADKLIRAGVKSRWDKVLLGMDDNGELIYHDFKMIGESTDACNYIYSIYGGSGSGKGNMTLALLTAAILDNCRVFYVDGKPDSGYALGLQAWKSGRDAFVFDGQFRVKDPRLTDESIQMEVMPYINNVRSIEEKELSLNSIPDSIFVGEEHVRAENTAKLLGVSRYLRGIEFWRESLVLNRDSSDWAVYVFDELTDMNDSEIAVREMLLKRAQDLLMGQGLEPDKCLTTYSPTVDGAPKEILHLVNLDKVKKDKERYVNAFKQNAGLKYIRDWCTWAHSVISGLGGMKNITIRKSTATTFIIFQNAEWINLSGGGREGEKSFTSIREFAHAIGTMSTKFVGRNALANYCGAYGLSDANKSDWYKSYINPEGLGNWALSKDISVSSKSDSVSIFKPFSCWGYVLDLNETRINDNTQHKERYFEYNISKLAEAAGVDVGMALRRAYDWANSVIGDKIRVDLLPNSEDNVKQLDNIKRFMYNASNFSSVEKKAESGAVSSAKAGAQGGAQGGENQGPNFDDYDDLEDDDRPTNNNLSFNRSAGNAETNGGAVSDSQFETPKSTEANQFNPNGFGTVGTVGNASSGNNSGADGQASSEASYGNLFNGSTLGTSPSVNMGGATEVEDKDAVPVNTDTNVAVARASQATATRGEGSNTIIDLSNTEKSTSAAQLTQGKDGNSIRALSRLGNYSQKQLAAIMDNPRKYNKFLDAEFNGIIDAIIKERGGRMAVRILELDSNKLLVDTKLVVMADTFECMGPDFMLELVSYPDIFGSFPKLTLLILDTAMFGLFEEQIEPLISDADIANGDDNAARYVLRHNASLNTIRVKGAGEYKKADLLAKDRQEAMKLRRERIANKAERSLKSRLNKVKSDRKMPTAPKRTFDGKAAVRKIAGKSVRGVGLLFRGIGKAIAFLARHSH